MPTKLTRRALMGLGLAVAASSRHAIAHDSASRRLTVNRLKPQALELVLVFDAVELCQAALAPRSSPEAFLLAVDLRSTTAFEASLRQIQVALQAALVAGTPNEPRLALTNWQLPPPDQWVMALREQKQRMVAMAGLEHGPVVEIRAQAQAPYPINHLRISAGQALLPVFVVNGPQDQFWLTPAAPSATLDIA